MVAIGQGDEGALRMLMQRHTPPLYSYAMRLSGSAAAAEDLLQDTWLNVWQKAASYKPNRAQVTTWLHRIVYHRFIDQRRRRRKHEQLDTVADTSVSDTSSMPNDAAADQLRNALEQLNEAQRSALLLRYAQGFGNADIAHIMGSSVRAVESLLARAKKKLHQSLKERT